MYKWFCRFEFLKKVLYSWSISELHVIFVCFTFIVFGWFSPSFYLKFHIWLLCRPFQLFKSICWNLIFNHHTSYKISIFGWGSIIGKWTKVKRFFTLCCQSVLKMVNFSLYKAEFSIAANLSVNCVSLCIFSTYYAFKFIFLFSFDVFCCCAKSEIVEAIGSHSKLYVCLALSFFECSTDKLEKK